MSRHPGSPVCPQPELQSPCTEKSRHCQAVPCRTTRIDHQRKSAESAFCYPRAEASWKNNAPTPGTVRYDSRSSNRRTSRTTATHILSRPSERQSNDSRHDVVSDVTPHRTQVEQHRAQRQNQRRAERVATRTAPVRVRYRPSGHVTPATPAGDEPSPDRRARPTSGRVEVPQRHRSHPSATVCSGS